MPKSLANNRVTLSFRKVFKVKKKTMTYHRCYRLLSVVPQLFSCSLYHRVLRVRRVLQVYALYCQSAQCAVLKMTIVLMLWKRGLFYTASSFTVCVLSEKLKSFLSNMPRVLKGASSSQHHQERKRSEKRTKTCKGWWIKWWRRWCGQRHFNDPFNRSIFSC